MSKQKNVVSTKQVEANRRNALKSRGPRTAEGKANSSQNAITHGILAKKFVIAGVEDANEFRDLVEGLFEVYQPVGKWHELLVERQAQNYWRLLRMDRYEHGAIQKRVDSSVPAPPLENDTYSILYKPASQMLDIPVHRQELLEAEWGYRLAERTLEHAERDCGLLGSPTGCLSGSAWVVFAESVGGTEADVRTRDLRRRFLADRNIGEKEAESGLRTAQRRVVELAWERLLKAEEAADGALRLLDARREQSRREKSLLPNRFDAELIIRYAAHLWRDIDRTDAKLRMLQGRRRGNGIPSAPGSGSVQTSQPGRRHEGRAHLAAVSGLRVA